MPPPPPPPSKPQNYTRFPLHTFPPPHTHTLRGKERFIPRTHHCTPLSQNTMCPRYMLHCIGAGPRTRFVTYLVHQGQIEGGETGNVIRFWGGWLRVRTVLRRMVFRDGGITGSICKFYSLRSFARVRAPTLEVSASFPSGTQVFSCRVRPRSCAHARNVH